MALFNLDPSKLEAELCRLNDNLETVMKLHFNIPTGAEYKALVKEQEELEAQESSQGFIGSIKGLFATKTEEAERTELDDAIDEVRAMKKAGQPVPEGHLLDLARAMEEVDRLANLKPGEIESEY